MEYFKNPQHVIIDYSQWEFFQMFNDSWRLWGHCCGVCVYFIMYAVNINLLTSFQFPLKCNNKYLLRYTLHYEHINIVFFYIMQFVIKADLLV